MEALTALHPGMHRQGARPWIRAAALPGGVAHRDHAAWLPRLPVCTTTRRRWRQAGGVDLGRSMQTAAGTPPGGGASPLLAPSALDGLARLFAGEETQGTPQRPSWNTGQHNGSSLMRHADALVVGAPARTVRAHAVLPTCARFLAASGRHLSGPNTHLVPSPEGGNFLGGELRRLPRAVLPQPQKAKRLGPYRASTPYLHQQHQSPAGQVIQALHPRRRGWGNSDRPGAANRACSQRAPLGWQARWRGATRRPPNTAAPWGRPRDCRSVGHHQGVFAQAKAHILWYQDLPIPRAPKVRGTSSPMPPALRGYGAQRAQWRQKTLTSTPQRKRLLPVQDCRCGLGKVPFSDGAPSDAHHLTPTPQGGADRQGNRLLVPRWWHHAHHQRHG
jgi:RNA-directed DNA polymerase